MSLVYKAFPRTTFPVYRVLYLADKLPRGIVTEVLKVEYEYAEVISRKLGLIILICLQNQENSEVLYLVTVFVIKYI